MNHPMKRLSLTLLAAISLCVPVSFHADENLFDFVYGVETLPAGHIPEVFTHILRVFS